MQFVKQDITTVEGPAIIAHGVNCQRVMGSGVAKALYTKWPTVRSEYMNRESQKLGDIQCVVVGDGIIVVNCFTQQYYGRIRAHRYASAIAVERCLAEVAGGFPGAIHIPRIGCGLGGLNWEQDVLPILEGIELVSETEFIIHDL